MDIKKIKQLKLDPGDYVIATIRGLQPASIHLRVKRQLDHIFSKDIREKGIKIIVVDDSMEIAKIQVVEMETEKKKGKEEKK